MQCNYILPLNTKNVGGLIIEILNSFFYESSLLIKNFFIPHLIRKKRITINKITKRAICPPELPVSAVCVDGCIANACEIIIK